MLARFSATIIFSICLMVTLSGCDSNSPAEKRLGKAVGESDGTASHKSDASSDLSSEFIAIADKLKRSENEFLGAAQLKRLAAVDLSSLSPVDQVRHHVELSWQNLRLGFVDKAIEAIDTAYQLRQENAIDYPLKSIRFAQAIANLRKAEVENCVKQHNCDCCIFPLKDGGVHVEREPALKSKSILLDILKDEPNDTTAIWFLNLIAMALGEYPDSIPEKLLIPPSAFESEHDIKRFKDIASIVGVDSFNLCGGVIVADFDGDQQLDIVTSTYDPEGSLHYYRNQGDGSFADLSATSKLEQQLGGLNCIGADYDGDGDTDILVLRGAWLGDNGQIRNSLLRNNGDGTFEDVSVAAGLAEPAYPTQAAVWGDFNNDGHLDLYVGNECRTDSPMKAGYYPSQLFINEGDGTFVDTARHAGVSNDRFAKGVAAGDFDNDGDLDIYVSNIGPNRLYRNRGDATFEDVAPQLNMTRPARRSFATWFFDYDNDGWLDLFVAAYEANVTQLAQHYLGQYDDAERPKLYRNLGDGTFQEIGYEIGLDFPCLPMGANFGDLDNDGYLDIYLTTGDPHYQSLMPNIMLRNERGERFVDVTTSGGFGHLQKGHGVAFADLDGDGDQDIYHQLGGFYPGDKFHNALFENPGHGNRFVILKLVGTQSHRSGIGARIQVDVSTPNGQRSIHRSVGSVSSFGGSPLRQEIGLGDATEIERIEITWPKSTDPQIISSVPLDAALEVTEGGDYRVIEMKSFAFGN